MEIKIWINEAGQRFDRFLRKYFKNTPEIKLNEIYSRIRKWAIKVNNKKTPENYVLELNDIVDLKTEKFDKKNPLDLMKWKEDKKLDIDMDKIKQQILYEDENWIFRNKPAGIVSQPWEKHLNDLSLVDILQQYVWTESETFKPAFCFRLDKDTSWIIVWAKNYEALKYLNDLIKTRKTQKKYLAIVAWITPPKMEIKDKLLTRFDDKIWKSTTIVDKTWQISQTSVKTIKSRRDAELGDVSLLEVVILTWRMHQIRVHLASQGFPILWDVLYWKRGLNLKLKNSYFIVRQLLHSYEYGFHNKFTSNNLKVKTPMPDDFKKLFKEKINI